MLCEHGHVGGFGNVLTDQSIGVLVGSAFPRVIRSGEVEGRAGRLFDDGVVVELSAVVSGNRFDEFTVSANEVKRPMIRVLLGSCFEFAEEQVAGFALDDTDEAVETAFADDRVDLPVADLGAQLGCAGPLADVSFTGQATAAVIGAIALASLLSCAAQIRVEGATETAILPDMLIDGFMADRELPVAAQVAGDLFWAPLASQQGFDEFEIGAGEVLIASRARATTVGFLDGLARPVVPPAGAVSLEFSRDRAAMPPERTGDLGLVESLLSQHSEHIPLFGGDLAIGHW